MTKLFECDVAVMGSGVAGMGAAYKLANAGGLKIAVFEKYPAPGRCRIKLPHEFLLYPGHPGSTEECL